MKRIKKVLVICCLVIIGLQHIWIFEMQSKLKDINSTINRLDYRMQDNSERIHYLEIKMGCSYGQSGEY